MCGVWNQFLFECKALGPHERLLQLTKTSNPASYNTGTQNLEEDGTSTAPSTSNLLRHKLHGPKASPKAIGCGITAQKFVQTLDRRKPITVRCLSSCSRNVGETDPGWEVFGDGPFRDDSCICKAALFAGVIGHKGGLATLVFASRADFRSLASCA